MPAYRPGGGTNTPGTPGTPADVSVLTPISELPELNAGNFGSIWNLNGILTENYADVHSEDTLDVTFETVAAGSNIGVLRWRGSHYGTAAIANPQNGDISVNLLDGGRLWQYFHQAGDEAINGWRQATQAVIDAVNYIGYRRHRADAEQLVAHTSGNKVGLRVAFGVNLHRVTAFVAGSVDHTFYHGREYVPRTPSDRPPELVLWGAAQDARFGAPDSGNAVGAGSGSELLKWKLDDSELWFGAVRSMVQILTAAEATAEASDADSFPDTAADRDRLYLKFQSGVWTFSGFLGASDSSNNSYPRIKMLRVADGAAVQDAVVGFSQSAPFGGEGFDLFGNPDYDQSVMMHTPPIRIAESDLFHLAFGDGVNTGINLAFWLRARYHGE